jgi:hypothetical protein
MKFRNTRKRLPAAERRLREAADGDHPQDMLWQLLGSPTFWRQMPPEGLFASRQEDDSAGTLELRLREDNTGAMQARFRHVFDWDDISPLKPLRFRMPGGGGRSLRTRKGVYAVVTASMPAGARAAALPEKLARDVARNELLAARAVLDDGNYWPTGVPTMKPFRILLGDKVGLWVTSGPDGDAHVEVCNDGERPQEGHLPADASFEVCLGDDRNPIRNALRFLALAIELDAAELPERDQQPAPPRNDL